MENKNCDRRSLITTIFFTKQEQEHQPTPIAAVVSLASLVTAACKPIVTTADVFLLQSGIRVLNIEFERSNDEDGAIRHQLLQLLIAENTRNQGEAKIDREIIRIKDSASNVTLGGIWTEILFDWMYVEVLYVPEALRGNGLGSQLLVQAEDSARSKGCVGIWLETFDFQAPDFYRKNGWKLFATLRHYPRGSNRRFLRKRLDNLDGSSNGKGKNTQ